jgi:hypothetical protein
VTADVVDRQWTWFVEVLVSTDQYDKEPTLANTRVRHRRQRIDVLARRYLEAPPRKRRVATAG